MSIAKSKNATVGSQGLVGANETLADIRFLASDGVAFRRLAHIRASSDGTPASGDMPGLLSFATTPAGSTSPTERLRITSTGVFRPAADDGVPLGASGAAFSDLFLASGAVINFNASDVTITHASNLLTFAGGDYAFNGVVTAASGTATPAAGSTAARLLFGTTAGFGIYYGSGAPTVSAAQGSVYLRSDGSSTSTRLYINTTGSTTWTNVTTAA
jgi:hypothetical protein